MDNEHKYLAYFPGVKAENFDILGGFMSQLLQDNINWRLKNYPDDEVLLSNDSKKNLANEYDSLAKNVNDMIVGMRGNIPFYSPRYIGHMLSDTSIPAIIGYMAGLLYNPNNVTTEAATVTVDWEIQVCNKILEMLGYTKAPEADTDSEKFDLYKYKKGIEKTFGWAHINSGGTLSNIEALWVARNIKYTALAIWDVSIKKDLDISLMQAKGIKKPIQEFEAREILMIKHEDAIELLYSYFRAVARKQESLKLAVENAGHKAWEWINQSKYSLYKGTGTVFEEYPPVIYVSGAGHYSIDKAADILGIGKENVQHVRMDSQFRMNVEDLERKITKTILQGKIPLAVIAIAGTTEEGAVDPIHKITQLRKEIEMNQNTSFWLHIDGAWGGYIRTLFTPTDKMDTFMKVSKKLKIDFQGDIVSWNEMFFSKVEERFAELCSEAVGYKYRQYSNEIEFLNALIISKAEFADIADRNDFESYLNRISHVFNNKKRLCIFSDIDGISLTREDRISLIRSIVKDKIKIEYGSSRKDIEVSWEDEGVLSSYLEFPEAESISIDAHKMGYVPYSCGVIAYKDDRIRSFIQQKAPYITGKEKNCIAHTPPKHIIEKNRLTDKNQGTKYSTEIDSFAPFILEGSRSGASACALWLAEKTIPLTLGHHGKIVKSTIMAARELYEWINRWNEMGEYGNFKSRGFEIIPLSKQTPDTNVITFIVKNRGVPTLKAVNEITEYVYTRFSANMQDSDTQNGVQPFYITKTRFDAKTYNYEKLLEFFQNNRIGNVIKEYSKNGLFVLRVTIMNPYIHLINRNLAKNYFKEFLEAMSDVADKYICEYQDKEMENKI